MNICFYKLATVDSTNSWAKRHLAQFAPDIITVITAEGQTGGYGRWGRSWVSPTNKNIYMTLVIPQTDHSVPVFCFSQITALVIQELLNEYGIKASVKWPNDVLVDKCKIAGILIEKEESAIIIGIGLNVNMSQEELEAIPQKATSILAVTGTTNDVEKVVERFMSLFTALLNTAKADNFAKVAKSWHEKVQWMLSEQVTVQTHAEKLEGHVIKVASDGSLLLQTKNGKKVDISSADIQII